MDTVVQYAIRVDGKVHSGRFELFPDAVQVAEDVYGVDNDAVQVVMVTTTFEVVA